MSYCRWSTDGFRCDLYAYQSSEGYVIHVAARRMVEDSATDFDDELPPADAPMEAFERYAKDYQKHLEAVGSADKIAIDLPHAGKTFVEPDLQAFKARLLALREIGYRFPDEVIACVEEEIAEDSTEQAP